MPHTTPDTTPLRVEFSPAAVSALTAGVRQRAALNDAILRDLSGEMRLVERGLIPPEILAVTHGFPLPFRVPSREPHIIALDIIQNADGQWTTVGDRTELPAGLGLLASFGAELESLASLRRLTEGTGAAILSGPKLPRERLTDSMLADDVAALSRHLRVPAVTVNDLEVRDWTLRDREGHRIELLLSYLPLAELDPLVPSALTTDGIPGLATVLHLGKARLLSHPATALFSNSALATFLPRLAREVLGEDLILHPVASFWCGDRLQCSHVISRIARLRVRSLVTSETFDGTEMTITGHADLCARIADEPWNWVAHEPVEPAVISMPSGEAASYVLRGWATRLNGEWRTDSSALGLLSGHDGTLTLAHLTQEDPA